LRLGSIRIANSRSPQGYDERRKHQLLSSRQKFTGKRRYGHIRFLEAEVEILSSAITTSLDDCQARSTLVGRNCQANFILVERGFEASFILGRRECEASLFLVERDFQVKPSDRCQAGEDTHALGTAAQDGRTFVRVAKNAKTNSPRREPWETVKVY
jgi:hypothetical protein